MAKRKLTKSTIDALNASGAQYFLWDVNPPGFGVRVSPAGVKSFIYQYRLTGGASRRTTVGRYGVLTVEQARRLAHKLAEQVRSDKDPVAAKREARRQDVEREATEKEIAFDAYCTRYLDTRVKPEGLASYGNIEMVLRLHAAPVLGSKSLAQITKRDMVAVLDGIPGTSLALRRSTFAILNRLLNWAVGRGDIVGNPMVGMKRPPAAPSRDRVLSDAELALALRSVTRMDMPFGPFYELLFATGQRRGEVAGLNWSELDRANALWTLPASRTKNGEANLVPLNRQAVAALDRAAAGGGGTSAVEQKWPAKGFVLSGTGQTPLSGFSRAKARLDEMMLRIARQDAAEIGADPDEVTVAQWRLHDARRTLATGLQRLGVRFEVTEAVLNHTSGASRSSVAAVYQRHTWGPEKRAALDAWADHCDRVLTPADDTGNVVQLRQGA